MVVDDDHDAADVVGEFLKTFGAEVRVVYGASKAIALAPHFQPRMVVLDLNMPAIDGFQTCRRLRQQAWSRAAVIIASRATGSKYSWPQALITSLQKAIPQTHSKRF
jgi:DNA-binding response OmpR family regulator